MADDLDPPKNGAITELTEALRGLNSAIGYRSISNVEESIEMCQRNLRELQERRLKLLAYRDDVKEALKILQSQEVSDG